MSVQRKLFGDESTTFGQSPRKRLACDYGESFEATQSVALNTFSDAPAAPIRGNATTHLQSPLKRPARALHDHSEKMHSVARRLFEIPLAHDTPPAGPTASIRRDRTPEKFRYSPKVGGTPYMSRGKYKDRSAITDLFNQQAIANEDAGSFVWDTRTIPFGSGRVGGAHCLVVQIPHDQPPLIAGKGNQEIIYKSFLKQSILSRDENISVGNGSAAYVLAQYQQLRDAGVPTATLYNEEGVLNGCGYFIFEFVPQTFQPTWNKDATIDNNEDLKVIYQLFQTAAQREIDADLRPSNLRRREDGTIVIVDLLESAPKKGEDLWFELENRIKTFCQKGDTIYDQLIQAIACLKPSYL